MGVRIGSSGNFAFLDVPQTFTEDQIFRPSSASSVALTVNGLLGQSNNLEEWRVNGALKASIDSVGDLVLAGSSVIMQTGAGNGTIIAAALSTDRTFTFPDITGDVLVTSSGSDPPASGEIAKVNRTGQNASIGGPVNLTNGTAAGFYLINCHIAITTAETGQVIFQISYATDGGGVNNKTLVATTLGTLHAVGTISAPIYLNSGNITWTVTYTGTGAGVYAIRIRTLYLGA